MTNATRCTYIKVQFISSGDGFMRAYYGICCNPVCEHRLALLWKNLGQEEPCTIIAE
jgi:hypothetical protein